MTDPTPHARRSPLEHERDDAPDLVERLRHYGERFHHEFGHNEAADRIEKLEASIDNACQSMAETSPNWEARCYAIMAALGYDFGGYSEDAPEVGSWFEVNNRRNLARIEQLEAQLAAALGALGDIGDGDPRPRVKPLVWVDARFSSATPRETAETILGTYEVLQWLDGDFGGSVPAADPDESNTEFGGAASMAEAKAAAQADYEYRILAALEG